MKKLKYILLAVTVFTLTGCSSIATELTEEESNIIADYSANILMRYSNVKEQVIAARSADALSLEDEQNSDEQIQTTDPETTLPQTTIQQTDKTDDSAENIKTIPLVSALGINGFKIKYNGYQIDNKYSTDYYIMSADNDKKLLILNYTITNTGKKDRECNILSINPKFKMTVNGTESVNSEVTILLNDLSTYKEDIKVNESVDAVLLFSISKKSAKNIKSLELSVTCNDNTANVEM